MARVVVLGAGVMGTAMTIPLADNGNDVHLVGTHLDDDIIESVRTSHTHPRLRTPVPEAVQPYHLRHLDEAICGVDLLVLGVNSQGISWAANTLGRVISETIPIAMIAKGMVGGKNGLSVLPDFLRQGLPESIRTGIQIAAVGGPSIAGELADRRHTCIVLAGSNQEYLEKIANMLRTPYYHVWTSTDMVGVEASVALKNIYAVGVGLVYGQLEVKGVSDYGAPIHNPAAAVFAQSLHETAYLVNYMGGDLRSVYTLPGAGDAFVTCQGGRNVHLGRRMGKGMTYENAVSIYGPNERPEGPALAISIGPTIRNMINLGVLDGTKLPLLSSLIDVFIDKRSFEIPWGSFFG